MSLFKKEEDYSKMGNKKAQIRFYKLRHRLVEFELYFNPLDIQNQIEGIYQGWYASLHEATIKIHYLND